jgi:hypothetical protein
MLASVRSLHVLASCSAISCMSTSRGSRVTEGPQARHADALPHGEPVCAVGARRQGSLQHGPARGHLVEAVVAAGRPPVSASGIVSATFHGTRPHSHRVDHARQLAPPGPISSQRSSPTTGTWPASARSRAGEPRRPGGARARASRRAQALRARPGRLAKAE